MKKKIIAFLCAFNMVFYGSIVPSVPVKAEVANIPVAVEMWEGFQTLFFTLGVSLLATDAVDKMAQMEEADQSILALANDLDTAAAEVLKNDWNEYKENLQYGYCKISNTLWGTLKNTVYSQEIVPAGIVAGLPSIFKNYFNTHNGYYCICNNCYDPNNPYKVRMYRADRDIFDHPIFLFDTDSISTTYRVIGFVNPSCNYNDVYWNPYENKLDGVDWTSTADGWSASAYFIVAKNVEPNYCYVHQDGNYAGQSIAGNISSSAYTNALDDVYGVDNNGYIISKSTGTFPAVVPSSVTDALIDDIGTGTLTWDEALEDVSDTEIDVPDGHLTLSQLDALIDGLDIDRLQTKFPFCIPHDMELLISGASSVSSNAPVIKIPLRLEFRGHVYYDENEAVVIDFNRFNSVVVIFREGFFVLFLLGLVYLTIEILQAFFVVTE